MTSRVTEFCVCPVCESSLADGSELVCLGCGRTYDVDNGVPILLPEYSDAQRQRYLANYEEIAADDLREQIDKRRDVRHRQFRDFVGDVSGKRVLDIGSSHALYLRELDAAFKVALDIAMPYLQQIPRDGDIEPICADAESLPLRRGFFDVILISDVLEHLLRPEALVQRLREICRADTRVFVHVPWNEPLESYRDSKYEFAHLRRFDDYTFGAMWSDFAIRRRRLSLPAMEHPLLFRLGDRLPLKLYDRLRTRYFHRPGNAEREFLRRRARIDALPRREWLWLRFYDPSFATFELRPLEWRLLDRQIVASSTDVVDAVSR